MFFSRCRKLATFIDPFSLSENFGSCKTVGSLFHTWQLHMNVFNNKLHGPSFLRSLRNFDVVDLSQALADFRFKKFLQKLAKDESADSFFTVCAELGLLHRKVGNAADPLVVQRYEEHIKSFDEWPLEIQCKALNVLPMLYEINENTTKTGEQMANTIVSSLLTTNPEKSDMLRLMTPCKELGIKNKQLFYILEPFIVRDSNLMLPNELFEVFSTYAECNAGTKDFVQEMMLKITINCQKMTASELGNVLKYSCRAFSHKIFRFQDTMIVIVQELMKKMQKFTETEFKNVIQALFFVREGNVHYYELLAIMYVKFVKNFSDQELIDIAYIMAQVGVRSEVSSKSLVSALIPMVLAQASTIQGHLTIEKVSPIGLIGNSGYEEFKIDQAKHFLFPELKKQASKSTPLSIDSVYSTTQHPLFSFKELVKLVWANLVLAENSNIETIDGTSLNLMIKLLNRQLEELNKSFKQISSLEYDLLVQIRKIMMTYFVSLKNVHIPKGLIDYTLHAEHEQNNFLNEDEKNEDEEFLRKLKEFCDERFISLRLPGQKSGKMMKEFYFDEILVNISGKVPGLIIRNSDIMRNGVINEVLKRKIKHLGKVKILSATDWGHQKSDEYFSQILET